MSRTILLAAILISSLACGEHHAGGDGHQRGHGESPSGGGEEGLALQLALQLDGAERWQLDDHTRRMLAVMSERVIERNAETEAAEELGEALDEDIEELIRGCTMTGAAHARLHEYLQALMPAVERLATDGGEHDARRVAEILDVYPRYFE